MNITEAVKRACEEPTLADALEFICVWESERVVRQALRNEKSGERTPAGCKWETCFGTCVTAVLRAYGDCDQWFSDNAARMLCEGVNPTLIVQEAWAGSRGLTC